MKALFSLLVVCICGCSFSIISLHRVVAQTTATVQPASPQSSMQNSMQSSTQSSVQNSTQNSLTNSIANVFTNSRRSYNPQEYAHVPFNVGFVPGISVGDIVRASTGKKILTNLSFSAIGNIGNRLEGGEFTGIFSVQTDDVLGVQASGIVNTVGGSLDGVQGAGIVNIVAHDAGWLQGAGIGNIVGGHMTGVQGAGIFNIAGQGMDGVQGAGIFNVAGRGRSAAGQFAGIFNTADTLDGIQAAGIFNSAKSVRGVQIGLLNFADDLDGIQIGLLSFVKEYGLRVDISTDEMRFIRFGVRTGGKNFYTMLTGGLQPFDGLTLWSAGWGTGYQLYLSPRDYIDIGIHGETLFSASSQTFVVGPARISTPLIGSIGRIKLLYGVELGRGFGLFIGPTLNLSWSFNRQDAFVLTPAGWGYTPTFWGNGTAWIGVTGGFRFSLK